LSRGAKNILQRSQLLRPVFSATPTRWISKDEWDSKKRLFFSRTKPAHAAADSTVAKKDDKKEEEIIEQIPWLEPEDPQVPEHQRSIPEFIKEWGWTPFLGLLITAGFSKEILLLGPNVVYYVTFFIMFGTIYLGATDFVNEYVDEERKREIQRYQNAWELLYTSLGERVSIHKADIATEAFVKDLVHHWKASEIEAAKYSAIKAKHDSRNEIVAQLEAIARKEKAVQSAGTKVVASALREHVREIWSAPDPKLKEQALKLAIDNLLNPQPVDPKQSPVYGLYINYLRGQQAQTKAKGKAKQ